MSPSESQLRSFLHGGEGETVDPNRLIAHARGVRHNRRVRLASVAAAVIAVGAVGTGTVVLTGGGSGHSTADSAALPNQDSQKLASSAPGAGTAPSPASGGSTRSSAAGVSCPSIPLRLMLPGGGGTGQFGGDGPLFDATVSSMQVCGYAAASITGQVRFSTATTFSGAEAGEIATSLNAASTTRIIRPCPIRQTRELVIYATAADGHSLKPVVVDYSSCFPFATNGTAARYDWEPPKDVAAQLSAVMTPNAATPTEPGGKSFEPTGSPVR